MKALNDALSLLQLLGALIQKVLYSVGSKEKTTIMQSLAAKTVTSHGTWFVSMALGTAAVAIAPKVSIFHPLSLQS